MIGQIAFGTRELLAAELRKRGPHASKSGKHRQNRGCRSALGGGELSDLPWMFYSYASRLDRRLLDPNNPGNSSIIFHSDGSRGTYRGGECARREETCSFLVCCQHGGMPEIKCFKYDMPASKEVLLLESMRVCDLWVSIVNL